MQIELLYVDDEIENLKAFSRVFKKDFKIHTAESGEEGLNIFEANPQITLLVSDQRMPGMSGVDFLNACKHINPDPVRILITGYADLESTINAINDAEIYRFIKKPWEKLDLLQTLNEAQQKYDLKLEIEKKNKELLKVDELKNKFMMLVNHELKTPLTIQKSYLDLFKETKLDEEQKMYLDRSIQGSERLEKLITEILYFLEIEKNDLDKKKEKFELSEASGIQDLTGTPLKTNKKYFCDAIQRLIQNAESHKEEGSDVVIDINDDVLEIKNKTADPVDIDLILKPFEINENAFNHTKGLGLGLSIAVLILTKLGVKTEIKSEAKNFSASVYLSEIIDR